MIFSGIEGFFFLLWFTRGSLFWLLGGPNFLYAKSPMPGAAGGWLLDFGCGVKAALGIAFSRVDSF